ncbi:MAG TPA: helix-turn-helix domain-containing protein [Anaerolineae bacterium]|nr:helix-turn-helix domain-containing protein [Anaerolineae bacterium]
MENQPKKQLHLTSDERTACQQIATGKAPYSQRAQAILALADGASQAEAAQQSGLTENQVRYWLGRFRSKRLDIFPESVHSDKQETVQSPPVPTVNSLPEPSPETAAAVNALVIEAEETPMTAIPNEPSSKKKKSKGKKDKGSDKKKSKKNKKKGKKKGKKDKKQQKSSKKKDSSKKKGKKKKKK